MRSMLSLLLALSAFAAEPSIEKVDVFNAGDQGYAIYRIPGLVVTGKGTVLAYGEARKTTRGDWGTIDIMIRRSTDGGKTWSPQRSIAQVPGVKQKNPVALAQKLATTDEVTYNNPVAIPGRKPGTVHFVFCLEYMRAFYMRSDDDGVTFSTPREITSAFEGFRSEYDWKVLATGPGHGIRLRNGRLVIPVWISLGTGGHAHRPSVAGTIYSDDEGVTWKSGEIALPNEGDFTIPNETAAVQLANGDVLLNSRTESKVHRRLLTTSKDGATKWTMPAFHPQLVEPICMGTMVRLSTKPNRLLFANPDNLARADGKEQEGKGRDRKNVTVQLSYDESKTWPVKRPIDTGYSGYSDLAVLPDGTILLLYERSGEGAKQFAPIALTLVRFNLEWLTDGKDSIKNKR
jgi:sialidase-1